MGPPLFAFAFRSRACAAFAPYHWHQRCIKAKGRKKRRTLPPPMFYVTEWV